MSNIKTLNKDSEIIKYLGIDWGEARIGLALADSETKLATPFKVVNSPEEIIKVVADEAIDLVIIGVPYPLPTQFFPQQRDPVKAVTISKQFTNFINDLKTKIKIPIEFIDERLSSKAADARSGNKKTTRTTLPTAPRLRGSRKLRRARVLRDAVAAMIILQTYLDKTLI